MVHFSFSWFWHIRCDSVAWRKKMTHHFQSRSGCRWEDVFSNKRLTEATEPWANRPAARERRWCHATKSITWPISTSAVGGVDNRASIKANFISVELWNGTLILPEHRVFWELYLKFDQLAPGFFFKFLKFFIYFGPNDSLKCRRLLETCTRLARRVIRWLKKEKTTPPFLCAGQDSTLQSGRSLFLTAEGSKHQAGRRKQAAASYQCSVLRHTSRLALRH